MKVLAILCVAVIATAFAQEDKVTAPPFVCSSSNSFLCKLQEIGHHIKFHAKNLGGKLASVGTSILSSALDQGKQLLASGSQAVLGTVLEHLNKSGLVGKRDMSDFASKLKEHFGKGVEWLKKIKEGLKDKFHAAVKKVSGVLQDTASLKKVEEDADKKIDDAVQGFIKDGKTGFVQMAAAVKSKLKDIFAEGVKQWRALVGKKDKRALLDLWNKAKEHFGNLVGGLSDTFKPHLDALKSGLKGLADKAKEHGSKLLTAAKGHFDALKGKLSGHLDTLKGHAAKLGEHAKTAVGALKEAVTSILTQTLQNASGTLKDAAKTGTDVVGVVGDHVKDALAGY